MNTSTSNLTNRFILLVVLAAIISCDSLTENGSIMQVGFSPTGTVGFPLGTKYLEDGLENLPGPLLMNKSIDKGETWTEEDIAGDMIDFPYDFPTAMAMPSENVVYILYGNSISIPINDFVST